jgi:hypothetical protein
MMNAVVYEKGTNNIKHFIHNCVKKGNKLVGDNQSVHINLDLFDVVWTDEIVTPIMHPVDTKEIVGWDTALSSISPNIETAEIIPPNRNEFKEAIKIRKVIDTMSYQELDNYIENNITDLASAKTFIKTLAKVVLALAKMVDSK